MRLPNLKDHKVILLSYSLDQPAEMLAFFRTLLREEEKARLAAMAPSAKDQFLASRGSLRLLVGHYLGCQPAFAFNDRGKPLAKELAFNLSHSAGTALLALARRGPIGVDVEWANPKRNLDRLAKRFYSDAEQTLLQQQSSTNTRNAAFYRFWVRKEAWTKAIGCGLTFPLDRWDVSSCRGAGDVLPSMEQQEAGALTLWDLQLRGDLPAALVAPEGLKPTAIETVTLEN